MAQQRNRGTRLRSKRRRGKKNDWPTEEVFVKTTFWGGAAAVIFDWNRWLDDLISRCDRMELELWLQLCPPFSFTANPRFPSLDLAATPPSGGYLCFFNFSYPFLPFLNSQEVRLKTNGGKCLQCATKQTQETQDTITTKEEHSKTKQTKSTKSNKSHKVAKKTPHWRNFQLSKNNNKKNCLQWGSYSQWYKLIFTIMFFFTIQQQKRKGNKQTQKYWIGYKGGGAFWLK